MSEYQYYEFRAIDRPLTDQEMRELRALSTRAQITPTSFTNEYHWGDFKGNPNVLMEKYFDAFVYFANWGTRRLMFRLPRRLVDEEKVADYCSGEGASFRVAGDFIVLEFVSDTEDPEDDWDEAPLGSLIPLRADLLNGDFRALYLGWLLGIQEGGLSDEDWEEDADEDEVPDEEEGEELDGATEPPVPPGLGQLSGPLRSFAEFLRIDEDLIAVAAERSAGSVPSGPSRDEWTAWIRRLPGSEKDALLLRVAEGHDPHLHGELFQRFRQDRAAEKGSVEAQVSADRPRTIGELLAAAEQHTKERQRREAERKAAEKAKREREGRAARAAYLDRLSGREPELWSRVEPLIATKKPAEYDRAVALLVDLRDLSAKKGEQTEFQERIRELRERHATKPSFMARLDKAGVGAPR